MQRSALSRSRRELSFQIDPNSNEYLLAKIGVDTAENEPLEVWGENSIQYSIVSFVVQERVPGILGAPGRTTCSQLCGWRRVRSATAEVETPQIIKGMRAHKVVQLSTSPRAVNLTQRRSGFG